MKSALVLVLVVTLVAIVIVAALVLRSKLGGPTQEVQASENAGSLWSLSTRSLEGELVDLSSFEGQVALVVNVASECGLTSQYEGLQALYEELAPRGFTVLGFPSNDFRGQEPGTAEEIRAFCTAEYGVSFPLFEKRTVSGEGMDEVYRFLTAKLELPTWNFTKYLVDREGRVLKRFPPKTAPDDAELRADIEKLLAG